MSNEPTSISALIDEWATIAEFAADVGCGYEAARQMRLRESIAPGHWSKVVSAAKARDIRGVTFEWLAERHASNSKVAAS
ncbi:hypothetical protein [Rhizobium leguminosarum]|uniref:hypothetical protein n=1 Tax=Rhizobium leguminosarum TaxID=384 RepID=UPI001C94BD65|nr:hypothetical protein [Rhizobium leguminosarum]MBY5821455.1 hypothetical protein [Rhizobium leguminosarum]